VHTFFALRPITAHGNEAFTMRPDVVHGKGALCRALIPLPSGLDETHGKESVAGQYIAVRSLPCVDAWQRRCRAFWTLCRAVSTHGKALFSGSECALVLWRTGVPNSFFERQKHKVWRLDFSLHCNNFHIPSFCITRYSGTEVVHISQLKDVLNVQYTSGRESERPNLSKTRARVHGPFTQVAKGHSQRKRTDCAH
jgi:hypothetical protein